MALDGAAVHGDISWLHATADLHHARTTIRKSTPNPQERGVLGSGQGHAFARFLARIRLQDGLFQELCLRVQGLTENLVDRPQLDNPTAQHDRHAVRGVVGSC